MKLSGLERRVLASAHLNAMDSITSIAQAAGCKQHQVRYCLDKFIDAEIIKPKVLIDLSKIGLSEFSIALSVAHENEQARRRLREFLLSQPGTADVLLLGGNYDYFIMYASRDSREILEFLRQASQVKGIRILNKQISLRVSSSFYRRSYLSKTRKQSNTLGYGENGKRCTLDELDRKILEELLPMKFTSFRDLGRRLELAHTTVQHRVQKLEELGVIVGYVYGFHPQRLGIHDFRLLVFTSGLTNKQLQDLRNYCAASPQIVMLLETVGVWDFEIRTEVFDAEDSRNIVQELYDLLGQSLVKVDLIPIFRYLKGHFGTGYAALIPKD